jgi:hypothetical protein
MPLHRIALVLWLGVTWATAAVAAPVTLVADGQSRVCIVLPVGAIPVQGASPDLKFEEYRLAAKDLAEYLGKMSGAQVVSGAAPTAGLTPIYVGSAPKKITLTKKSDFGDAYVVDVTAEGIVLDGESPRAVSYAAAHLLQMLGVRWYGLDEMGEVVPKKKTLTLESGRIEEAPHFQTRNLGGGGRWEVRNRLGGPMLAQGHAFYGLMGNDGKLFEKHPEYFPIVNGKPSNGQANLANPALVDLFANNLLAEFRRGPNSWAGGRAGAIGPDDGLLLDERPESRAMDGGDTDPLMQVPSATDRYIKFVNAVAAKLEKEFPDHTLGFYVYSNHNFPPRTVKPNKMIVPVVAPIAFNRYLSIGNPNEATSVLLKDNILAWRGLVKRLGVYLYNFNLADTAMPYTRRLAWSKDFPNLYQWGVHDATLESLANWHTMIPGNYVTAQLLWNTKVNVPALLDEFYATYYGPAGPAMREYNTVLEDAYESTQAYAGCTWSMHRIFTPVVMTKLEAALAKAEADAKVDALLARRVGVSRYSLNFAKRLLAMRTAINEFRLADAEAESKGFLENYQIARKTYPGYFVDLIENYFTLYHHRAMIEAGKIAREGTLVLRLPDEMPAFLDSNKVGERMGLQLPEAKTGNWTRLKTYSASMDELGQPFFRGLIWYRHDFELPAASRDFKVLNLWLGGVDDIAHVWLNGKDLGTKSTGNFGPATFDLSAAINRTGSNTLVLSVDNSGITELGTGGLVRPALIYAPK